MPEQTLKLTPVFRALYYRRKPDKKPEIVFLAEIPEVRRFTAKQQAARTCVHTTSSVRHIQEVSPRIRGSPANLRALESKVWQLEACATTVASQVDGEANFDGAIVELAS